MVAQTDQPFREWLGVLIEDFYLGVPTEVGIIAISPAQGAMFAPLALKLVQSNSSIFLRLTRTLS
jgi:hypothetical protein